MTRTRRRGGGATALGSAMAGERAAALGSHVLCLASKALRCTDIGRRCCGPPGGDAAIGTAAARWEGACFRTGLGEGLVQVTEVLFADDSAKLADGIVNGPVHCDGGVVE